MPVVPVNYLAVLACGIASMGIGSLWYGPVFGKQWIALMGWTPEKVEQMKAKGMWKSYALMFVGALLMAYVLAHSLIFAGAYLNASGISAGIMAGFWNWLGFVSPVLLGIVLWEGKSWGLYLLNVGYYFVVLLVMGVILAMWV